MAVITPAWRHWHWHLNHPGCLSFDAQRFRAGRAPQSRQRCSMRWAESSRDGPRSCSERHKFRVTVYPYEHVPTRGKLTSSDRYGVRIKAKPAATLQAPTPTLRMGVGYSSAVYTGIMVLPALMVNLPIIRNVIFSQSRSACPSVIAAQQQATPAQIKVAQKSHFLPTLVMMYMATAMAGISTRPASACGKDR